jgi:pimeloyl-ACP methyl ester carboxylesterase
VFVTGKAPPINPGTPSDFCVLNGREDARLSDVERLTVLGGASLDRLLGRLGKSLSAVTLSTFAPGLDIGALKTAQIKLHMLRTTGEIEKLFAIPTVPASATVTHIHGFPNGGVYDLELTSQFPQRDWAQDREYLASEANTTSYVRLWEHAGDQAKRTTVVAIHGWTMGDQRVNSLAFLPGLFYQLGCNVALVELPFHGRRRPADIPEDVPLFPSADPIRTCVAMAHALYDLRRLRMYLEQRGHQRMACVGMSLGAYVGALWAARDRLARAALLVPLVSMGDMAVELFKSSGSSQVPAEFLRDLFEDHSPLKQRPATPQSSIMVIGGEGDHLVPRSQITLLQKRWPHATVEWVHGGHAAGTNRAQVFDRIAQFLTGEDSPSRS